MIHAFVLVDAVPDRISDLAQELVEIKGVSEVYSVTGETDLVVVARVGRHEDLADIVTRHISRREGILSTRTMIAFQAYSQRDLNAMWDLGVD